MDFLKYAVDVLKFDADFEQAKLFLILPIVCALVVFVIALFVSRSQEADSRIKLRSILFSSVLVYSLGNLIAFSYIFLRPNDPRWAPEEQGIDLPGVSGPEVSGLPLGNDAVNDFFDGVTGSLNSSLDVVENRLNEKLQPAFEAYAYRMAFDTASDFLLYAGLGFLVLAILYPVILLLNHRDSKRREELRSKERQKRDEWNDRELIRLSGGNFVTYDTHMARQSENQAAYWKQVERAGHTESECWPMKPDLNYIDDPNAYSDDAALQYEAQNRR